ncbi:MAG: 16S rRNA (guanine(527)-N(7))-methyltransferase RsmG [Akkermansiaceae bacterium]|nr:16S rRNA (guanine(527)-N(7))-methyltransferase RsmG [Akkermansiaceae bacterium]
MGRFRPLARRSDRGGRESGGARPACLRRSRETLDRLRIYEDLLRTWQKTINLVSPATLDEVWHRHFADSAQLLALVPEGGKFWMDLGSGGGFPGLVLAIMLAETQPDARQTLVESDSRKAAFLGEVARKTGVAVEIRAERSEKAATQLKSQIKDVVTARALAPLPKLLGLVQPFFSPRTVALFPKGREAQVEVGEARELFDFDCSLAPSLTDAQARIVILRNLAVKSEG